MNISTTLDQQIGDFAWLTTASLRSGYSLRQIFEQVAQQGPNPIAKCCARFLADLDENIPIDEALANWKKRTASTHLSHIISVLQHHRRIGGNLPMMLAPISKNILSEVGSDGSLYHLMHRYAQESGATLPDHMIAMQAND